MLFRSLAIPRRYTAIMKEVWALQPRFEQRTGKRPFSLLGQERFRAGYDFLLIRAQSGEVPMELAEWWERFQDASPEERQAMLLPASAGDPATRRKRRRRRKRPASATSAAPE